LFISSEIFWFVKWGPARLKRSNAARPLVKAVKGKYMVKNEAFKVGRASVIPSNQPRVVDVAMAIKKIRRLSVLLVCPEWIFQKELRRTIRYMV